MKLYLIALSILILACASQQPTDISQLPQDSTIISQPVENSSQEAIQANWMTTPLIDITTNQQFSLSQFKDKYVLVEVFAVWCPNCKRQLQVMQEFKRDDLIHVSINTDPNEDASTVQKFIAQNNFEGYFAISPAQTTQQLIDEFGINVVSAPSVPVILICPDKKSRLLPKGHKDQVTLEAEISQGC